MAAMKTDFVCRLFELTQVIYLRMMPFKRPVFDHHDSNTYIMVVCFVILIDGNLFN